jgi:hypothetical protein
MADLPVEFWSPALDVLRWTDLKARVPPDQEEVLVRVFVRGQVPLVMTVQVVPCGAGRTASARGRAERARGGTMVRRGPQGMLPDALPSRRRMLAHRALNHFPVPTDAACGTAVRRGRGASVRELRRGLSCLVGAVAIGCAPGSGRPPDAAARGGGGASAARAAGSVAPAGIGGSKGALPAASAAERAPNGEPPLGSRSDAPPPVPAAVRDPIAELLAGDLQVSGQGVGCPLGEEWRQRADDPNQGDFPTPSCRALARQLATGGTPIEICAEDPNGAAWAVVATRRDDEDAGRYSGTWRIVRIDRAGHRWSTAPEAYSGWMYGSALVNGAPTCFGFRDLDGNGVVEALALHHEGIANSFQEWRIRLWTGRGNAIVPYRSWSALPAFTAWDVDQDGRLDLLINPYARSPREPIFYFSEYPHHSAVGWSLLAHATADGGFSTTDDVARRYARALCPAPPSEELPADDGEWVPRLHCALLWGASESSLLASVRRACAREHLPESIAKHTCSSVSDLVKAMSSRRLPLTLADPG